VTRFVSEVLAWLKVIVPGVNVRAWKHSENSEVLPAESVAVAVMKSPAVNEPAQCGLEYSHRLCALL